MIRESGYLLDTNVLSETRRSQIDRNVAAFLDGVDGSRLYLSTLTLGEFHRGIEIKRRSDPDAAQRIGEWLEKAQIEFADRILPVSEEVARKWGLMSADRTRPVIDTLIAATASVHDLILVTRNVKDVQGLDIRLLDPWKTNPRPKRSSKAGDVS